MTLFPSLTSHRRKAAARSPPGRKYSGINGAENKVKKEVLRLTVTETRAGLSAGDIEASAVLERGG